MFLFSSYLGFSEMTACRAAFLSLDVNENGYLSREEVRYEIDDITLEDFLLVDTNGDYQWDWTEFKAICTNL